MHSIFLFGPIQILSLSWCQMQKYHTGSMLDLDVDPPWFFSEPDPFTSLHVVFEIEFFTNHFSFLQLSTHWKMWFQTNMFSHQNPLDTSKKKKKKIHFHIPCMKRVLRNICQGLQPGSAIIVAILIDHTGRWQKPIWSRSPPDHQSPLSLVPLCSGTFVVGKSYLWSKVIKLHIIWDSCGMKNLKLRTNWQLMCELDSGKETERTKNAIQGVRGMTRVVFLLHLRIHYLRNSNSPSRS